MGVIKLQTYCSDFNKNSKSMVLIILLTLIITVGKIILNYHFKRPETETQLEASWFWCFGSVL